MSQLTGRLFIREESETECHPWDGLTKAEVEFISHCINHAGTASSGYVKEIRATA